MPADLMISGHFLLHIGSSAAILAAGAEVDRTGQRIVVGIEVDRMYGRCVSRNSEGCVVLGVETTVGIHFW